MKVNKKFIKLVSQSLAESIDQRSMVHLARELIPDYDINKSSNLPSSLDIPRQDIARQIMNDMDNFNLLIPFLNIFFSIQTKGFKGRKYKISKLRSIVVLLFDMGFSIDSSSGQIYEDPLFRISRNWGVLQEGNDYAFTFIWCDIVESSLHVKKNSHQNILKFYENYHSIVRQATEFRNGRIWHIEGDGILSTFHFGDQNTAALFTGIEILHRFIEYNLFDNSLLNDVKIRICINNGICQYFESHDETKKCDHIKNTISYEKYVHPNSILVNTSLASSLEGVLAQAITAENYEKIGSHFKYSVQWEE